MNHDDLILRSLRGRLSPRAEIALDTWRSADPNNEAYYQDLAAVWRAAGAYGSEIQSRPPALDVIVAASTRRRRRKLWHTVGRSTAAAAVAAVVVGLAIGNLWDSPPSPVVHAGEIVTGAHETVTTRLTDGTVVRLAPRSRLHLPGEPGVRQVFLDGRAFFAVSPDPKDPFVVRTPQGEAQVLGTRFDLDAQPGQLRLIVIEGHVALGTEGRRLEVRADEVANLQEGEEPTVVPVNDPWALLDWMNSYLVFKSTPLDRVGAELARKFGVTLRFDDSTLARETVTAWFSDEPIDVIVAVICRLVEAECVEENATIRMTRLRSANYF